MKVKAEKTKRLFVAVDPAPEVRDAVKAALDRIKPLAPTARWVDPAAMHVTLAFLGDIAERDIPGLTEAIAGAAARSAPMDVRFTGGGTFGGKRPRVLWIGVVGDLGALGEAHVNLGAALAPHGYKHDHPELTPHLTLARAGDRAGNPALDACADAIANEDFGPTRIAEVVLYQSDLSSSGARYTPLARLPFSRDLA